MFNDIIKLNLIYFIFGILFIIKLLKRTAMYRIIFGFILIATMGCGPAKISISGKVSYDGIEVNEGAISFESPDGKSPSVGGMCDGSVKFATNNISQATWRAVGTISQGEVVASDF